MDLLYAEVVAVVLGLVVHVVLPRSDQTGVVLLPAVAGVATALVWVGLTWLRVEQAGPLMWLVSLVAGALSALAVGVPLRRSRTRADAARLAQVGHVG